MGMNTYARQAKKLQSAINQRTDAKITINTQQWYSEDRGRVVTCYVIKQSVTQDEKAPYRHSVELYRTYSTLRMLLFLRDYWYDLNGWEIPQNETWEGLKDVEEYTGTRK